MGLCVWYYGSHGDLPCVIVLLFTGILHSLEDNIWRNRCDKSHLYYCSAVSYFVCIAVCRPWSYADRSLWRFNGDVAGKLTHRSIHSITAY